nr:unnamed protein product [Naegleria fowleri]
MGDKEGFIYRLWPSIESHRHQPHIAVWDLVSFLPNDGFHIYMDSELGHYKTATLLNENSFKFIMKCNSSSLEGECKEKLKETKLSEGSYTSLTDGDHLQNVDGVSSEFSNE